MKDRGEMIHDFTVGSVPKQLLAFASPLFLSNLLQIVYNMVDMIVVGQYAGNVGLSGVSVGGDITSFLTFFAMGFSNAGQIIISQYIGANKRGELGRFIGTMLTVLLIISSCLTVVGVVFRRELLDIMNTPPESYSNALGYATVSCLGLISVYGYNAVSAIMRGMGDSRHPFIFIAIAALLNIGLDLLFVGVFNMSSAGAALATVISQTVSFTSALFFLYKNRERFGFSFSLGYFKPKREMVSTLVKLGLPMGIKNAAIMFSKLFVNSWINSYGVNVSAVAGIAGKINSIANLFATSFNTAGASMVGQNIGAQQYKRVPKIIFTVLMIMAIICAVMVTILSVFPEAIFRLFTQDPAVIAIAMEYLPSARIIFMASALRSGMNALINGSGNYKVNLLVAILDGLVLRVGLALLLGLYFKMGYAGFWLGDAVSGFTPFVIGSVYFLSGRWKTRKYVLKEEN